MARIEPADIPPALIARYSATPARQWSEGVFATPRSISAQEYADALPQASASNDEPLSLYVHLPFCPVRCLNCDNNTTITHSACEIDHYLDALDREMNLLADRIGEGRQVVQLHMGGGSPNYLAEPQLLRLVDILERHFAINGDTESSLEANPRRTSLSQLDLLHGLGFRRVNFAVRDVDPGVQHAIGRVQSLEMVDDAFCSAREAGFETISMDLMYGLPCQTTDSIQRTVEDVLALGPDRVSCFSYTRQPDRFAHQRAIEPSQMPSLADKLSLFSTIVDGLTDASYTWVGLDSFAKADDPLCTAQAAGQLSRNWMGYTSRPCSALFGLGTNSISDMQELYVQNFNQISDWQSALARDELPIMRGVRLDEASRKRRAAMMQLMCNMELRDYAALLNPEESSDGKPSYLSDYARDGLLTVTPERVAVTPNGRYLLQHIWGNA